MSALCRWLKHDANTLDGWFLPVAEALLATLAQQPITLVLDGSVVHIQHLIPDQSVH